MAKQASISSDDLPTLMVQTTFLHPSDQSEAAKLGQELYSLLTRPLDDPLGFGAGIPVLAGVDADHVVRGAASRVVVIPVLGANAFYLDRRRIVKRLNQWHQQFGEGRVLIVPLHSPWRAVESKLPSKQFLTELYGQGLPRQRTLEEIILALTRVLQPESKEFRSPRLFISHAKADLKETPVADELRKYILCNTTGESFFDATQLKAGESLSGQLDGATSEGVLVAIHGDAYSSRSWCQRELLNAKRNGVPTVTVEVMNKGEERSSPYAGNAPSIVWDPAGSSDKQAAAINLRCMIEWLRASHFIQEGRRIKTKEGLPLSTTVIARPPELLDVANGRVNPMDVVLYPDPELPEIEKQVLNAAYPRLQHVTPATAYRLSARGSLGAALLEQKQIAISISDSPDANGPEGFLSEHVQDAIIALVRRLASTGAGIAYGGDHRMSGYTDWFQELIAGYNDTAVAYDKFLQLYVPANIDLNTFQKDWILDVNTLKGTKQEQVRYRRQQPSNSIMYFSDMRRWMSLQTAARVIIGGKTAPKFSDEDVKGYSGIYPGVVEEAWWTLHARKPLYVLGGFGGAAGLLSTLLLGKPTPPELQMSEWKNFQSFSQLMERLKVDPNFAKLKLPKSMDAMADAIRAYGKRHMATDRSSIAWNGLSKAENETLFTTRDPLIISSLVLKGLVEKHRIRSKSKLKIELVHGSITRAERLNAIAISTFDDVPLAGAGAALDRVTRRRASIAHESKQSLVALDSSNIGADFLFLASLGKSVTLGTNDTAAQRTLLKRIGEAAKATCDAAKVISDGGKPSRSATVERRVSRIGVITFGGAMVDDVTAAADAMLKNLVGLGEDFTIVWFELDQDRFDRLHTHFANNEAQVILSTKRIGVDESRPSARDESLLIHVGLIDHKLNVTAMPPAGSAIARSQSKSLTTSRLSELGEGAGASGRETPANDMLIKRGHLLGELILGKDAETFLQRCGPRRIVFFHDTESSRIPFELMNSIRPQTASTSKSDLMETAPLAVRYGISRRLAVSGASVDQLFARIPKTGPINLLLIINPTEDLPGTEKEAKAVVSIIEKKLCDSIRLTKLTRAEATRENVLKALSIADVVHYCGHAFYNGPGDDDSGLILAGDKTTKGKPVELTLKEIRTAGRLPRMAFFNACEAARVRAISKETDTSRAFAEYFLRSGIEAFLGTYWQVSDVGAASFATSVYSELARGATLDEAVRKAREILYREESNEWANYILYGNGAFRLVN